MAGTRLGLRMAIRAREDRIIRGICMTGGTYSLGIAMVRWEPRVIERCTRPGRRIVARVAGGWESGCLMVRIRGAVVLRLMARVAVRRRVGEIVVDVAARTRDVDMGAGKRKRRGRVSERCACPCCRGVTCLAGSRESGCRVVRVIRAVPVGLVAGVTVRRRGSEIGGGVAAGTRDVDVRAREGERRAVVIEGRPGPGGGRVAERAICWESGCLMVRIRCTAVRGRMARIAIRRRGGEIGGGVATGARDIDVSTCEGERRVVVIEGRTCPGRCTVARVA